MPKRAKKEDVDDEAKVSSRRTSSRTKKAPFSSKQESQEEVKPRKKIAKSSTKKSNSKIAKEKLRENPESATSNTQNATATTTTATNPTNSVEKNDNETAKDVPMVESKGQCGICLDELTTQVLARLDKCIHPFCFECIMSKPNLSHSMIILNSTAKSKKKKKLGQKLAIRVQCAKGDSNM